MAEEEIIKEEIIKNEIIEENEQKEQINVSIDSEQIVNTLKAINTTLTRQNEQNENKEKVDDDSITIVGNPTDYKLVDKQGKKLSDYEICKRVLPKIKGKNTNIPPKFVEFMENLVKYKESGGNVANYKENNIYAPNIDALQF